MIPKRREAKSATPPRVRGEMNKSTHGSRGKRTILFRQTNEGVSIPRFRNGVEVMVRGAYEGISASVSGSTSSNEKPRFFCSIVRITHPTPAHSLRNKSRVSDVEITRKRRKENLRCDLLQRADRDVELAIRERSERTRRGQSLFPPHPFFGER